MNFIKQWILSVSLTLIISVIFSMLSPKGAMGRFYKIIISVFIFISFILPIINFDFGKLELDFDLKSDYNYVIENTAESQIKSIVNSELIKYDIENAKIDAVVYEAGDEIEIDNITVGINSKYDSEEVENMLYNNLGLVCEVVYYE